eukprot:GEMP01049845.1.p1 GENE.GEMP01049845.1~~GEMP01049845.1.p1  ORF type:complete len:364 (+),score=54.44 GEMP01049845.1:27-1094(+)
MDAVYAPTISLDELGGLSAPSRGVVNLGPHASAPSAAPRPQAYGHGTYGRPPAQPGKDEWAPSYMRPPDENKDPDAEPPEWSETFAEMGTEISHLLGDAWTSVSNSVASSLPTFFSDCAHPRTPREPMHMSFPTHTVNADINSVLLAAKMRMVTISSGSPPRLREVVESRTFDHQNVHHGAASEKWYFLSVLKLPYFDEMAMEEVWTVDHRMQVCHIEARNTNWTWGASLQVNVIIRGLANEQTSIETRVRLINITLSEKLVDRYPQLEARAREMHSIAAEILEQIICGELGGSPSNSSPQSHQQDSASATKFLDSCGSQSGQTAQNRVPFPARTSDGPGEAVDKDLLLKFANNI